MKQNTLPFDLQFFAEEDGTETGGAGEAVQEGAESGKVTEQDAAGKDGTAPEGDGKEGGNADREDIAALVQEEIRKASMKPEEREAYEKSKKEKELSDRETAISLRERKADAKELLSENGLPAEFTDMVIGKDKKETMENVKNFKEKFDAAVQEKVEERLKGKTPDAGTGHTGDALQELKSQVESYL